MAVPTTTAVTVGEYIHATMDAIQNNQMGLDDAFQHIEALNLPIAGVFVLFKRRSKRCSPEELVRMKAFLYARCFNSFRQQNVDVTMLKWWLENGSAKKRLWNVVLEAHAHAQRYLQGVAALARSDLPIDLQRAILERVAP